MIYARAATHLTAWVPCWSPLSAEDFAGKLKEAMASRSLLQKSSELKQAAAAAAATTPDVLPAGDLKKLQTRAKSIKVCEKASVRCGATTPALLELRAKAVRCGRRAL